MGAPERHARLAAMLADMKARGDVTVRPMPTTRPLSTTLKLCGLDESIELLEIMTADDVPTQLVYTPEQLEDGSGARVRLLTLMDAYYPTEAPHYWREFDMFNLSSDEIELERAADAARLPNEVVYAPKPWVAELNDMAQQPDHHDEPMSHANFEPSGMRQSAVMAILVSMAVCGYAVARWKGWL